MQKTFTDYMVFAALSNVAFAWSNSVRPAPYDLHANSCLHWLLYTSMERIASTFLKVRPAFLGPLI